MEALDRFRPGTNIHATIIGQRFHAWHWGLHQAGDSTLSGTARERARLREQQSAEYEAALQEDRRREVPGRAPSLSPAVSPTPPIAEDGTLHAAHLSAECEDAPGAVINPTLAESK